MAINPNIERPYREQDIELCQGWVNCDEDISLDEYVRAHATPEYLEWYEQRVEELEELDRKYPDVMW